MKAALSFTVFSENYQEIVDFHSEVNLEFMPREDDTFRFDENLFLNVFACNYCPVDNTIVVGFTAPKYSEVNRWYKEETFKEWIVKEKKRFLDLGFSITYCDVCKDKTVEIK